MNHESKQDGRRALVLILLLAMLGLGGGAGVRMYMARQAAGGGTGATVEPAGSALFKGAGLSNNATAMWTHLLDALGHQGARKFTIAGLVELLKGHKDDAAAQAFAAEFGRNPELQGIWSQYLHSNDALDATWLAQRLSQSQAFSDLLNRCAEDPSCRRVSDSMARDMRGAVVAGAMAGVTGTGEMALGSGSAAPAGRGAQGPRRENWRALEGNAEAVAALRRAASGAGQGERSGSGSFNTTELKQLGAAGDSISLAGYTSLFKMMDRDTRDKVIENLDDKGNVWDACSRAEATESCKKAIRRCGQDSECKKYMVVKGPPPEKHEGPGHNGGPIPPDATAEGVKPGAIDHAPPGPGDTDEVGTDSHGRPIYQIKPPEPSVPNSGSTTLPINPPPEPTITLPIDPQRGAPNGSGNVTPTVTVPPTYLGGHEGKPPLPIPPPPVPKPVLGPVPGDDILPKDPGAGDIRSQMGHPDSTGVETVGEVGGGH